MFGFHFEKEQKVFQIGDVKVGGQPGENPTVMLASMFHKGDKIVTDRKKREFDKDQATKYIKGQEEASAKFGVPCVVDIVANSGDEFKTYIDFVTSVTDVPIGIDAWVAEPKIEASKHCKALGIQDKVLYNSITPWAKGGFEKELEVIVDCGIKNVLVVVFDNDDQTGKGRMKSFECMMETIGKYNIQNIWVDTSTMNIPCLTFSGAGGYYIKEKYGLPVGCAPSNGSYAWKAGREMVNRFGFAGIDSATHALTSFMWADFLFYGPMTAIDWVFPAVACADMMKATMAAEETGKSPAASDHPLTKLFPDLADQLK
jgi:tetrahydromethanopterin S-methyltransferase subunit H